MSSQGMRNSSSSSTLLARTPSQAQEPPLFWTDDLPVCHLSGVGFSTNQIYREDGFRREEHEFEDRSFHFWVDGVYLYGVLDGHDGSKVAHFAAQRMPAELLLGQLAGKTNDEEIQNVLRQAFVSVEKGFFDSIDDNLAEKANLQLHVPEGISSYEAFQKYPALFKKLELVEAEIGGGTQAVVASIVNNRLYIANVGCSRALLCRTDADGILRYQQLTVDHNLSNQEELLRLANMGLDVDKVTHVGKLGSHNYTRCIGDYAVKSNYSELYSSATSEPVIPDPEVIGGIEIDDSCCFLILMSDGLYTSLEDSLGSEDQLNAQIASMVAQEFAVQSTLNGVAQAVVDKAVRIHHDTYMTSMNPKCAKRDDITLLVRNFNYPLPNAISSPSTPSKGNPVSLSYYHTSPSTPLSVIIPTSPTTAPMNQPSMMMNQPSLFFMGHQHSTMSSSQPPTNVSTLSTSYQSSNESSDDAQALFTKKTKEAKKTMALDDDGKVQPYVDFSDFYRAIEELTESQRETLDAETEPKPAYETICEEEEAGTSSSVSSPDQP